VVVAALVEAGLDAALVAEAALVEAALVKVVAALSAAPGVHARETLATALAVSRDSS
jgi:hypothetical protein